MPYNKSLALTYLARDQLENMTLNFFRMKLTAFGPHVLRRLRTNFPHHLTKHHREPVRIRVSCPNIREMKTLT